MRQTLQIVLAAAALGMLSGCSSVPTWVPSWAGGPTPVRSNEVGIQQMSMKQTDSNHPPGEITELHYEVESEHVAKDAGCASEPAARLLDKGPGYETYTIACANAQMMVIRCDFSYCHKSM
jgi:hypothetical protein